VTVNADVSDRVEIAELLARLAHLLDESRRDGARPVDADDVRAVYTDDVTVHSPRGGALRGADAVTDLLRRSRVEGERTQHSNTDVLVDLDGDRAEVSANQFVHFYRDGEPPHRSSGLHLAHTAVRTPAGWRFREAWIVLAWTRET
jgi:hypothetical protein